MCSNADIKRLETENAALRAQLSHVKSARKYADAIATGIENGLTRAQACAEAARRFPAGRKNYLLKTNRLAMAPTIRRASKLCKRRK